MHNIEHSHHSHHQERRKMKPIRSVKRPKRRLPTRDRMQVAAPTPATNAGVADKPMSPSLPSVVAELTASSLRPSESKQNSQSNHKQELVPILPRGDPLPAANEVAASSQQKFEITPKPDRKRKDPPSGQGASEPAATTSLSAHRLSHSASSSHQQTPSPLSRRESLPLDVRNKKMKPTDCLLFAATLLASDGATTTNETTGSSAGPNGKTSSPEMPIDGNASQDTASLPDTGIIETAQGVGGDASASGDTLPECPAPQRNFSASKSVRAAAAESLSPQKGLAVSKPLHTPAATAPPVQEQALLISKPAQATAETDTQAQNNSSSGGAASIDFRLPNSAAGTTCSTKAHETKAVATSAQVRNNAPSGASAPKDCSPQNPLEPKAFDVLGGRGGKVNSHPGNIIFRRVVAHNKAYYLSVHKRNRILVSQSIVQAILNYGGRFVTMAPKTKTWTAVEFKKAVQKTSQALREFKKKPGKRKEATM